MTYLQTSRKNAHLIGLPDVAEGLPDVAALCCREPPLPAGTTGEAIAARFDAAPALLLLAVVDDDGLPLGMITRAQISSARINHPTDVRAPISCDTTVSVLSTVSSAGGWRAMPASALMDAAALRVDIGTTASELVAILSGERPSVLSDGFIATCDGRYAGVVNPPDILAMTLRMVGQQAQGRQDALAAAQAACRAKTAFLANASHEIRTPLNAIMGFAELLASQALGPLGHPRYAEYAGDIVTGGRHLMDLINDLLDLSKAEVDRLELSEGPCDLPRLTMTILRLVTERAEQQGISLCNRVPFGGVPTVVADERKVRQMLLNLVSNALKFTPAGGTVTVYGRCDDDGVRLTVADDGIGMTEAELARALEPWGQIDHAINRQTTGTGLGLPLTKRLIELHGGRLEISSTPGQGTTMALFFPPERICGSGEAEAAE